MRASGVLMHISSLPSSFGIGTFGKNAYKFVDLLEKAGQTYWQILPLCPTSYGDSPYQSFSTFAGNPYFIDLDILSEQGFLSESEYKNVKWCDSETKVDYGLLYINRHKVFKSVAKHFFNNIPNDYDEFCLKNAFWLEDFALFMAIKDSYAGKSFLEWDEKIIRRDAKALIEQIAKQKESIDYYKMLQYLFFKQWSDLKKYANDKGVKIIGDLPIYVALDSADVWSDPKQFMLDEDLNPIEVAGCPPDAFSKDGQLWGNPLYDWEFMKNDNYGWWKKRLKAALEMYDVVRIDHFRGFDSYYCIKANSKTAKDGIWREGPKMDLFKSIKKDFGKVPIIAEDLGFLTKSVRRLLKQSTFPGMKVLQFAFDSREESDYLPHNYTKNSVVYTGTHDNDTNIGWQKTSKKSDIKFARQYLGCPRGTLNNALIKSAMASVSDTAIITMQDILELDSSARMNIPSTVGNNWSWRAKETDLNEKSFEILKYYTNIYCRMRKEDRK